MHTAKMQRRRKTAVALFVCILNTINLTWLTDNTNSTDLLEFAGHCISEFQFAVGATATGSHIKRTLYYTSNILYIRWPRMHENAHLS
jgi:hypothetical protein